MIFFACFQPVFNSVVEGAFDSGISGGWVHQSVLVECLIVFAHVACFSFFIFFNLVIPAVFHFRFAISQPFQKCGVVVVFLSVHQIFRPNVYTIPERFIRLPNTTKIKKKKTAVKNIYDFFFVQDHLLRFQLTHFFSLFLYCVERL